MNAIPGLSHQTSLLIFTLTAVVGLVLLIARFKLNAFVALIMASLFVGLCAGLPLLEIVKGFESGVGKMLGSIAMVIGLGTVLGKLMAESGGAEVVAARFIHWFGERRIHWAMMCIAFLVGIPVFFAVGLVLLVPIVFTLARETRTPLLRVGIPMLAGLSVAHGLIPPHPGPMTAIGYIHADAGKTILYAVLVGLPTTVIAGPLFGRFISGRVTLASGGLAKQLTEKAARARVPGFGLTVATILLPIFLMILSTAADMTLAPDAAVRRWADFLGSPLVALLLALLFSLYSFGGACGFTRQQLLRFSEECLGPIGSVLLVVGAGGGFSGVLDKAGVGDAMVGLSRHILISPLLLGWLLAALIRVATGSATVAIGTAASLVAPLAGQTNPELLVLSMGAGSLILSHVNDGGFWLVKEYFQMSVTETLATWTVMETIISIVALILILLLNLFL